MKTPKEKAEEIAGSCAGSISDWTRGEQNIPVYRRIQDNIPIEQFIEVAIAANALLNTPARSAYVKDAISHDYLDAKCALELALKNLTSKFPDNYLL